MTFPAAINLARRGRFRGAEDDKRPLPGVRGNYLLSGAANKPRLGPNNAGPAIRHRYATLFSPRFSRFSRGGCNGRGRRAIAPSRVAAQIRSQPLRTRGRDTGFGRGARLKVVGVKFFGLSPV